MIYKFIDSDMTSVEFQLTNEDKLLIIIEGDGSQMVELTEYQINHLVRSLKQIQKEISDERVD